MTSVSPRKHSRDEDTQVRLQNDFAGEFGEIRKSSTKVNGNKLISGASTNSSPLKLIRLSESSETSAREESDFEISDSNEAANGFKFTSSSNFNVKAETHSASFDSDSDSPDIQQISSYEYQQTLSERNFTSSDEIPDRHISPEKFTKSNSVQSETHRPLRLPKLIKVHDTQDWEPSSLEDSDIDLSDREPGSVDNIKLYKTGDNDVFYDADSEISPHQAQEYTTQLKTENTKPAENSAQSHQSKNNSPSSVSIPQNRTSNESLKNNENQDDEENDEIERGSSELKIEDLRPSDIEITQLKSKLYAKLNGRSEFGPYCLDSEIQDIHKLVHSTVVNGQRNSCFIIGPRNSGKTSSLNTALRQLRKELKKNDDFLLIRINGLAQQDDKAAVRSIAEQLDSEISRVYDVNLKDLEISELLSRKSISVTFANILKILDKEIILGEKRTGKIQQPIIFVVDEVDVYANQTRQSLLYNLFELTESSPTPVSVLCLTSKFTVKDLLEKRVRSRFSQRTIQFTKLSQDKFITVATKILSIDNPENPYEEKWNEQIAKLISEKSVLRKLIAVNHLTSCNIKEFLNHCLYPVSKITQDEPFIQDIHFSKYSSNEKKSSLKSILNSLSDLELYILVSAARVQAKQDLNWVNLNIIYEEYVSQMKIKSKADTLSTGSDAIASSGYKIWSKESCRYPWEVLQNIGILTQPVHTANRNQDFSNSSIETKMWHLEITLDELRLVIDPQRPVKSWTRL